MPSTRYNTLDNVSTDKTLKQFKQWREERRRKKKDYSYIIPNSEPQLDYLLGNKAETSITWIGHSTCLIQYEGLNIVTDPVWASRMGVQRRLGAPGIPIDDVPDI
ncbi:MBL fold metallo-hydrolase, partial [Clostridium perfringens]